MHAHRAAAAKTSNTRVLRAITRCIILSYVLRIPHSNQIELRRCQMPPKPAESAASSALPPALDDLEAELKLKHSRKGVADGADVAATADASAARAVAAHDDGSSAVAQALAASGVENRNPLFFILLLHS